MGFAERRRLTALTAISVTAIVLVAALLAACGGSSSPPDDEAVQEGGDLTFVRSRDIVSTDPKEVVDVDSLRTLNQMYERLYQVDPTGKLVPWLATDYSVSDDNLTWTFTLRPGVKFHNGQEMTSADVKFSIDRARKEANSSYIDEAIGSVETDGPEKVVITTKYPWAPLLADISAFVNYIIPKDFAGESEKDFFAHPIGTGPFKFESWDKGQEVRFVRNDDYWRDGVPHLDSVTFKAVPDSNAQILQLRGGEADIVQDVPVRILENIGDTTGLVGKAFPVEATHYLLMNEKIAPFDDLHVRRALALAIDRQAIVDSVLSGHGDVANSFVSPEIEYHAPDIPALPYDPTKARQELAKSSVPDGFSTELVVPSDNADWLAMAQIVERNFAEIGVEVELRQIESTQLYPTISAYDYEMAVEYWTSEVPDVAQQVAFMTDFDSAGSYSTAYRNPEVAKLATEAARTLDSDRRRTLYEDIQRQVAADVPYILLYYSQARYAFSDQVQGLTLTPQAEYRMEDVWLSD